MAVLLDPALNVLPPLLAEKNSDDLTTGLMSLIDVATSHPKMFRHSFSSLVQFAISVIKEKDFENDARQAALELLVTFAEGAPAMCRNDKTFSSAVIEQTLSLMCDHDDDPAAIDDWQNTEDVYPIPVDLTSARL
jgi:importin-5